MISRSLSSYIYQLQYRLQEAIIYQVSDDFMDITSTIKTLREVALLPQSIFIDWQRFFFYSMESLFS